MDIHLPGESGIACTARLKEVLPSVQVIMVTVYRNHELIFQALQAGACGYLLKRSSPDELLKAITEVRSGGAPMTSEIARMVVEAFQKKPATSGSDELTTRETQILAQLGTAPDQEIAQRLGRSVGSVKGQRVMLKIRSFPLTRESAASAGRPGIGLRRRKLSWAQPRMRLWPSG